MTAPLNSDAWGEDRDYYNDRPGAAPPPLPEARPQEYSVPKSNMPVLENSITYDNNKGIEVVYCQMCIPYIPLSIHPI
jgi:hypothetical protein